MHNSSKQYPGDSGFEPLHFMENTNVSADPCNSQWLLVCSVIKLQLFISYGLLLRTCPRNFPKMIKMMQKHFILFSKFVSYLRFILLQDQCKKGHGKDLYAKAIAEIPPIADDRRSLCQWLTHIENYCRKGANLPIKSFKYRDLMKRWRYADGYL